jgi:hypothetical protein
MPNHTLEKKTHQIIDAYIQLLDKYTYEQLVISNLTRIVGLLVKSISTFGWHPKAFSSKMQRFV